MATINLRIDETLKRDAEALFSQLGLTMTSAISVFLHACVNYRGIPFKVALNPNAIRYTEPKALDSMSVEELNAKLQHSYEQSIAGVGEPALDTLTEIEEKLLQADAEAASTDVRYSSQEVFDRLAEYASGKTSDVADSE